MSVGGDSDSVFDLFDQSRSIIINYCSEHHERGKNNSNNLHINKMNYNDHCKKTGSPNSL